MKRGGPLPRKTPLRSYTPLKPGGELSRSTPLESTPMPRRAPDVRTEAEVRASRRPLITSEEKRARDLVRERSNGDCEGCGQARAAEWAHRVSRAQQGPWCAANGLHLCNDLTARPGMRGCHEWSHSPARPEAEELGWILRSHHDYLTFPVVLFAHGRVLLNPDGSVTPYSEEAA